MTDLTVRAPTDDALTPPTTPFSEPWLTNLRRAMGRQGNKPILMTGFTITAADHAEIQNLRSTLARQTTGGLSDRPAIGVELAKLIAAFPTQDPGVSAALRVEAYSDAIGTAPAWAVREARLRVVRGSVTAIDKRFAPTPPQLAEIVTDILRPLKNDLSDLVLLEQIGVTAMPDEAERTRVGEGFQKLAEELGRVRPETKMARARTRLETICDEMGIDRAAIDALPDAPARDVMQRLAAKGA